MTEGRLNVRNLFLVFFRGVKAPPVPHRRDKTLLTPITGIMVLMSPLDDAEYGQEVD